MFADRIEAKWINTFEKAFEPCKVVKAPMITAKKTNRIK